VLLTGSGDGLCGPLPALLQAVAYHPPTVHVPAFPAICLLIVHLEISFLFFPPSLVRFQCTYRHPFHCVLVFSSLFIVQDFFGGGAVWPGGCTGLSQGWLVEYCMAVGTHLFGLMNVSQAGLEPAAEVVVAAVHLFSQCNVVWRSFLQARDQGV
jgi:hypothetical protein